jgi:CheY-like chemotaxis protein
MPIDISSSHGIFDFLVQGEQYSLGDVVSERKYRTLVLDDDELIRELFRVALEADGRCEVVTASAYREAEQLCQQENFDIFFLDYHLPEGIGWNLANQALNVCPGQRVPHVILMSGTVNAEDVCVNDRFSDKAILFSKPFSVNELYQLIDTLVQSR